MDAQLVKPPIFRRAEQQMPEEDGHEEDGRGNPDLDTDGLYSMFAYADMCVCAMQYKEMHANSLLHACKNVRIVWLK